MVKNVPCSLWNVAGGGVAPPETRERLVEEWNDPAMMMADTIQKRGSKGDMVRLLWFR
jgi:hypothetical protein